MEVEVVAISCTVDYSGFLELAPSFSINGREAYERYIQHTLPYLADSGGELIYLGEGGNYFIGPEGEDCDLVMLERQSSLYDFISFASNEDYLKGVGHLAATAGMLYGSFFGKLVDLSNSASSNIEIGLLTTLIGMAFVSSLVGMIASIVTAGRGEQDYGHR